MKEVSGLAEAYVALEEAAELEGVKYNTMVSQEIIKKAR